MPSNTINIFTVLGVITYATDNIEMNRNNVKRVIKQQRYKKKLKYKNKKRRVSKHYIKRRL